MYTLLCISAPDNIVNLDALYNCSCIVVTLHDIKLLSIKEKKLQKVSAKMSVVSPAMPRHTSGTSLRPGRSI